MTRGENVSVKINLKWAYGPVQKKNRHKTGKKTQEEYPTTEKSW